MKLGFLARPLCALALSLTLGAGTSLAQTTLTGTAGGDDSWNDPSNWSAGVPSGTIDAIVGVGVFAQTKSQTTPYYNGSLTLGAGATLKMHCSGSGCGPGIENAVAGAARIFLHTGSEIQMGIGSDVSFPPITLMGDAKLSSIFGASDWQVDDFTTISGAHTLTLEHFNGHEVDLNATNGFSELIVDAIDRWHLHARAAGSLGTGDVTVTPRPDGRSASLHVHVPDAMADTATLTLNGSPGQGGFTGDGSDYLILNADLTVASLFVYGVEMPEGTYDDTQPWLAGPGTLTVMSPFSFTADPPSLSIQTGGVQTMTLSAGPEQAGLPYLVLGSVTGTSPGLQVDADTIPLVADPYLLFTANSPNTPPLSGSFGTLDGQGAGTCLLTVPTGAPAALVGSTLWHAYVVIKLEPTLLSLSHISNPVALQLDP